ncbi:VanZ family protein [Phycicoccus sp. DTK01]|uniref:VanZ family protein n=1 Tax=Phycicoccus sp. DTK01 TaxID=2785745 RepID=UPI001A8CFBE1|nr:VanZ family protein [Phycicoccus sp. DTK01]
MTLLRIVLRQEAIQALLLLALVASVAAGLLARRAGRDVVAWTGTVAAVGVVVALTQAPVGPPAPVRSLDVCWSTTPLTSIGRDLVSTQGLANVLLFVPLGVFVHRLVGSAWWVVAGGAALSVLIELAQALQGGHDCTPTDVVANTVGTACGVVVHLVVVRVVLRLRREETADGLHNVSGPSR